MYVENGSWVGRRSILDQLCDLSTTAGIGTHWWKLEPRAHRIWSDTPSAMEVQRVRPTGYEPVRQDLQCVAPTTWSDRDRDTHVVPLTAVEADLTLCRLWAPARQGEQQDDAGETIDGVP